MTGGGRPVRVLAGAATAVLLAVSCRSSGAPAATNGPPSSPPASGPSSSSPSGGRLADVRVRLVRVANLEQPLAMSAPPAEDALYIAEKTGRVVAIRAGRVDPRPVLDLSDEVSGGGEQGLLGVAVSPDDAFVYVNYTDREGNTHVTEFALRNGVADASSRRDVLSVDQPFSNHNGGNLVFGPDGYLYIGLGDGGSGGDPLGNGQSLKRLLAKMLRIDPRPSGDSPYAIPEDNPFADTPGVRPEIWAFGLRNPWRYSFDRQNGDLWIGDVGQDAWEEIDFQSAGSGGGENYGWNRMEGNHPFEGTEPSDAVRPVFELSHDDGNCSVTGGYVYRGTAIPGLEGAYVFGDFCDGRLIALAQRGGRVVGHRVLGPNVPNLASFGEDQQGELYALSLSGEVYRIAPA
jgi:glucose/arabinose dehydrogenase